MALSSAPQNMTYNKDKTVLTAKAGFSGTLKTSQYASSVKVIDASKATKSVTIYGNANSNSIQGGSAKDVLRGEAGSDRLYGNGDNDRLYGGLGKDNLNGGAGNDRLYGEDGDDILYGGAGKDTLSGGAGNDRLYGEDGNDSLTGGAGNDTLDGGTGNDCLYGEDGNDRLSGGTGNDTLTGGAGKDVLRGGQGKDSLCGNEGDDRLYGEADDDTIYGNGGADILYGGTGNDTLRGGGGNDSLYGEGGNDRLLGDAGNDTLYGGKGNDILTGGAGNDWFRVLAGEGDDTITDYASGQDIIHLASGNSTISGWKPYGKDLILTLGGKSKLVVKNGLGKKLTIVDAKGKKSTKSYAMPAAPANMSYNNDYTKLTAASVFSGTLLASQYTSLVTTIDASKAKKPVRIYGNGKDNVILGSAGNSTLAGAGGNDRLYGYGGNDSLLGGAGNDILYGGGGKDILSGDGGEDRLYGEAGNDTLAGGSGNDTLSGGAGNDSLSGSGGNDRLYGDDGDDVLQGGDGNDLLSGGKGKDTLSGSAGADTLQGGAGNDSLSGGAGNDELHGNEGDDVLNGNEGNDRLYGEQGLDFLYGNDGADTLLGGDGQDYLYGGAGNDSLRGDAGPDHLRGDAGNDTLLGGDGADMISGGTEHDILFGGSGADSLSGDGGNDELHGGDESDTLRGGTGNDKLYGEGGLDWLYGEDGSDSLYGGEAMDRLYGGDGDDVLFGEGSSDWLYGDAGNDTLSGGEETDYIFGGTGNDVLFGENGNDSLHGEDGEDTISGGGGEDSLYGGAGADVLSGDGGEDRLFGEAGNDTLMGGMGNDTFTGGAGNDWFCVCPGEGNDVITDYESNDVIQLTGKYADITGWTTAGGYAVLEFGDKGKLVVNGGANRAVTIADDKGNLSVRYFTSEAKTLGSAQEVIHAFVDSLVETSVVDVAVYQASGGKYAGLDALVASFMADFRAKAGTYERDPETRRFLREYCDVILHNDDTGAITGFDAGGGTVKTDKSIVPEKTQPASWSLPASRTSTFDGLTVEWYESGAYASHSSFLASLTNTQQTIIKGLNSEWIPAAVRLAEESLGIGFQEPGTFWNRIRAIVGSSDVVGLAYVTSSTMSNGLVDGMRLTVNTSFYSNIRPDDENGSMAGQTSLDRTLAHEFTHAVMSANIPYANNFPLYISEGMAELVHGIDDERLGTIYAMVQQGNADSLESIFAAKNGTNGASEEIPPEWYYAAGYLLLRYMAKQSAEPRAPQNRSVFYGDPIQLSDEENLVWDISLSDNGQDALLSTAAGTITVRRGAGMPISVVSPQGMKGTYLAEEGIDGRTPTQNSQGSLVVPGGYVGYAGYSSVCAGDYLGSWRVNASCVTNWMSLVGREGMADVLIAGNTSNTPATPFYLSGLGGDDTLYGGRGYDCFYSYDSGNEVIVNYTAGQDKISLRGDVSNLQGYMVDGNDLVICKKNGSTLTVKDVKADDLTVVDISGEEVTEWKKLLDDSGEMPRLMESANYISRESAMASRILEPADEAPGLVAAANPQQLLSGDSMALYSLASQGQQEEPQYVQPGVSLHLQ